MKKAGLKSRSTGISGIGGSLGSSIGIGGGGSGKRNNNISNDADDDPYCSNGHSKSFGTGNGVPGGMSGGMKNNMNGMAGDSSQYMQSNRGPQQNSQYATQQGQSYMQGTAQGYSQHHQQRQHHGNGQQLHQHQQGQPPQTNGHNGNNVQGPNGGANAGRRKGSNPNATDEMVLSQKNHRLAKELSDLRVRHREECKVVSRLTMENMNLASRCREAISQVAALKKEVHMYQKRQNEWQTQMQQLQREQHHHNIAGDNGKKKHSRQNSANADSQENATLSKRSSSPTTDLDRIMSQQFSNKRLDMASKNNDGRGNEKKEPQNPSSVAKKFQELSISTELSNTNTNVTGKITSKRPATTYSKPPTVSDANNLASANTKIPISINPNPTSSAQIDDEFDADIDMVDFFAKSQATINASPSSDVSVPSHVGKAHRTHTRKGKGTDDHMPEDVVSPQGGFSPGGGDRKQSEGSNLLSIIDAFEASFASAFPDTSFTITSESPSSASLNMAFDVPDFGDPFFSSSGGNGHGNSSSNTTSSSSGKSIGIKSQIQNLFPESAMSFKTSPMQNPVFDSPINFSSVGMPGSSSSTDSNTKGRGPLMAPEKLENTFSKAQGPVMSSLSSSFAKEDVKGAQKQRHSHNRSAPTPLSPQSMSAEIQQLDAIANLTSTNDKLESSSAPATGRTRKLRNVKQPVSYAEPSLNSKLRRGDVLFPKVVPEKKYQQNNSTIGIGAGGEMSSDDMNGKNPEEVLKDLEQSTSAMIDLSKD
mmetsp:Transcript_116/g.250  ORF Transcript_116/g.250 Transcript_116/m.250 type:complete len:761 (+) Transcript_116:490-2772(+)